MNYNISQIVKFAKIFEKYCRSTKFLQEKSLLHFLYHSVRALLISGHVFISKNFKEHSMYLWWFSKEATINTLISTCLVETFIMSFKQFESNLRYPPNERTFFFCITGGKPIKGQNRTAKEIAPLTLNWPVISTNVKETLERTQGSSYDINNLGHKNCQRDDRFKNGCRQVNNHLCLVKAFLWNHLNI